MRRRLLALCLLTYPRSRRSRDGDYLRDLALDLAERTGVLRQALSLVLGGLGERARGVRRGPGLLAGSVVVALLAVGGVAAADRGTVDVEVQSCVGQACATVEAWAAAHERDGWECERTSSRRAVSWQCARP
jgi:hypothetical protein